MTNDSAKLVSDEMIELGCRAICKANGWNADEPVKCGNKIAHGPSGKTTPQWQMWEKEVRAALEAVAANLIERHASDAGEAVACKHTGTFTAETTTGEMKWTCEQCAKRVRFVNDEPVDYYSAPTAPASDGGELREADDGRDGSEHSLLILGKCQRCGIEWGNPLAHQSKCYLPKTATTSPAHGYAELAKALIEESEVVNADNGARIKFLLRQAAAALAERRLDEARTASASKGGVAKGRLA